MGDTDAHLDNRKSFFIWVRVLFLSWFQPFIHVVQVACTHLGYNDGSVLVANDWFRVENEEGIWWKVPSSWK